MLTAAAADLVWSTRRRRIVLLCALPLLALVAVAAAAWTVSPSPLALAARVDVRLQRTTGLPVPATGIAPIMEHAVVATEDERFYRHHGIDLIGVIRALPYDLTHLSFAQGASTITEQVAKLLYLDGNDHNPWRKLEDAAVAVKLEDRYSKAQILAAYLTAAYFGENAYGIQAASERYFGTSPTRLDAAQATLLAGLIQAPSLYDPVRHPELARIRQEEVLRSLVRNGDLTASQAEAVVARPLPLRAAPPLPPVQGVDLSPGPAFVRWELTLGVVLATLAVTALVGTRLSRLRLLRGVPAIRLLLLIVLLLAAAAIVRSFRTA